MTAVRSAADALLEAEVLISCPDKPITFASGMRSPVYMDIRPLIGSLSAWRTVIEGLGERIEAMDGGVEVVAGVEDAVTTRGSSLEAAGVLREAGGEVTGCLSVAMDLLAAASRREEASPWALEGARRRSDPHDWSPGA
ncbi:MAG: hypothetical protein OXM62_03710 [bacterium]|nr:hypothetical protein [bacterium]